MQRAARPDYRIASAAVAALALLSLAPSGCLFHLDDVLEAQPFDAAASDAPVWPEGGLDGAADTTTDEPAPPDATEAGCGDGSCPEAGPSCSGVAPSCGATGDQSCCASATVPGGPFLRSYDGVTYSDGGAPATVSAFRLDLYEVTVARFRAFVNQWPASRPVAGDGAHPALPGSGWNTTWDSSLPSDKVAWAAALRCATGFETWTDAPGIHDSRPINCVTWYDAFAFCAWDGGRLPTEAEWNFAASGGGEQRVYPWSQPASAQSIDWTRASYYVDDTQMCFGDGTPGCSVADLVPVGSKAAGAARWGQADLAGNVMEWVLDAYAAAYPMPCSSCANLVESGVRVMRGGCFDLKADKATCSYRFAADPAPRYRYAGFRCAR